MMEQSIREYGFGDSMTVDRDGVVISGGQRLETLADIQMDDPIIVQSDGTRPIIHQRIDLTIDDPKARALAIAQNRVGQVNLDWDAATLKALSDESLVDLDKFFFPNELVDLFTEEVAAAQQADAGAEHLHDSGSKPEKYNIVVECDDAVHQAEVLESLKRKGLKCRVMG
jgi:hypothetical protein